MSILDDAIREHLELKRAHGADDVELKKLEDEAFGPPQRPDEPDPYAEAPTEFLVVPEVGAGEQADEPGGRRAPNIADLQEAPELRQAQQPTPASETEEHDEGPSEEEHPAMEHEAIREPEPVGEQEIDSGHSTEERHAIAEQPTELFDVEREFGEAVEPEAAAEPAPPAESAPPAPPSPAEDEPADEFDEFFSEQRLSDELNQALEAPLPDEPGAPPTEEAPAVFVDVSDDADQLEEDEPAAEPVEEPSAEHEVATPEAPPEPEPAPDTSADAPATPAPGSSHEDVLEDTPEFLEDAPEDDHLWFEQKPPKDFDFDD
jgi:hypothetical protein